MPRVRLSLIKAIVLIALLNGCGRLESAKPSTIFGRSDFRFVERPLPSVFGLQPNPVDAASDIQVPDLFKNPRPRCTAFFVSSQHFMTASHCKIFLQQARLNYQSTDEDWLSLVVADESSQLSFLGETTASEIVSLTTAEILWNDSSLDAMIVRWAHSSTKEFIPPCAENFSNRELKSVILWGFPNGLPLSESAGQIVRQLKHSNTTFLLHDLDSLPGESGGPLIQRGENSESCVTALHVRGAGQNIFNPGPLANSEQKSAEQFAKDACQREEESRRSQCEETFAFNKAIPMDAIAQKMKSDAPDLWQEIFQRSAR
ncbi:MAG: Trypsin-like peptidase domain [Pseudomonadota bacterium]